MAKFFFPDVAKDFKDERNTNAWSITRNNSLFTDPNGTGFVLASQK